MTISTSGSLVDSSTYESPTSMTILGPSDVMATDVENGDDKEIFDEEMAHS